MVTIEAAGRRLVAAWRTLAALTLAGAVVAVSIASFIPPSFTSTTSFVPQSRPTAPSGLSGLAAQFGVAIAAGEPAQTPAFYVSLVQSQFLLRRVAEASFEFRAADGSLMRGQLADFIGAKGRTPASRMEDAVRRLRERVSATVQQRTGIVSLTVRTRHAALSQDVAERIVEIIDDFNRRQRQSQAAAERKFTDSRLQSVGSELRVAEGRLEQFLSSNRDVRNSPPLQLIEERLRREVDLRQQVFTTLAQSLERAKIDEVRDTPVITVIDPASLPVRSDSRNRGGAAVLGMLAALALGALWLARREVLTLLR